MPDHTSVDGYKIEFNTSNETIYTNKTNFMLESDYKAVLTYTVSAFNCYGYGEDATKEIYVGKTKAVVYILQA